MFFFKDNLIRIGIAVKVNTLRFEINYFNDCFNGIDSFDSLIFILRCLFLWNSASNSVTLSSEEKKR